jgi:hypothetical protein
MERQRLKDLASSVAARSFAKYRLACVKKLRGTGYQPVFRRDSGSLLLLFYNLLQPLRLSIAIPVFFPLLA